MTYDEVVSKWSPKHEHALTDILTYITPASPKEEILFPARLFRNRMSRQIFSDFGYSYAGEKIVEDEKYHRFKKKK